MKYKKQIWFTLSAWPVPVSIAGEVNTLADGIRIDTDIDCYCESITKWTASVNMRWKDLPNWLPFLNSTTGLPDLDSMPINNNQGVGVQDGITDIERQTVMNMWSMSSSPLWIGGDITNMDITAYQILTNTDILAVNQIGSLPKLVTNDPNTPVYSKSLNDGKLAVAVFNLGSNPMTFSIKFQDLELKGRQQMYDLVSHSELGVFTDEWVVEGLPSHGSRLITLQQAS